MTRLDSELTVEIKRRTEMNKSTQIVNDTYNNNKIFIIKMS